MAEGLPVGLAGDEQAPVFVDAALDVVETVDGRRQRLGIDSEFGAIGLIRYGSGADRNDDQKSSHGSELRECHDPLFLL